MSQSKYVRKVKISQEVFKKLKNLHEMKFIIFIIHYVNHIIFISDIDLFLSTVLRFITSISGDTLRRRLTF